jgi:hypothetical protein
MRFSLPALQDELCGDLPAGENCILSHRDPLFEENSVPTSQTTPHGNYKTYLLVLFRKLCGVIRISYGKQIYCVVKLQLLLLQQDK